ncbi:O-methyltransferase [Neolentinus lepideus HHB14362 ss-1]|uniref:O-methyltransferase n=1 Tax=Neolentinus lepideus HHB14362 ss-1 TaxID=1314782 RepID=A0A165SH64_9AGAM|nr:O-methyltransferase [Neolentinus lepideus HHB14362 ss-1]
MTSNGHTSPLRALANLIVTSVDQLEEAYAAQSVPLPSLDDISGEVPDLAFDAEVRQARAVLVSACAQLQATVQLPTTQIMHTASGHYLSACINVALRAHTAEALRPAGDKGLSVEEIAKYSAVNPRKLARCLRMLATNFIFRELEPNVFAHNSVSLLLDTGKKAEYVSKQDPVDWYSDTDGNAAMICWTTGEHYKYAGGIPDTLLDPETAHSYKPGDAAFSRAVGRGYASFFEYISRPEGSLSRSVFNSAMVGTQILEAPDFILHEGLGWDKLPPGSVVVDVGGGVGGQSLKLSRAYPHLNIVVQDLPATIYEARYFWNAHNPEAIQDGRVTLQPHNFFDPNPVRGAAVYFLREISHNWPNKEAIAIHRHVRDAADAQSRIILVNHVIQYGSASPGTSSDSAKFPSAPYPLLPNFGPANARAYIMDMVMLCQMNAVERTTTEFEVLLREAGLKIDDVVGDTRNGDLLHLVCSRL